MKSRWCSLLLAGILALLAHPAGAQDYSNIRIVRLSFVEGNVQYQRPGQDWQDAKLNLPIQEGFALRTADGYAEVEFEDALTLRLATNATVEFAGLALQNGGRITKLTVPQGTAIISAKLKREDAVSVAAPNLNLNLPRSGHFRMDVSPTGSWVTVFHGKVEVNSQTGATMILNGGHTLHLDASGSGSPEVAGNPPQDDFDKWVFHREEALNSAATETSSVLGSNSYTTGYADLYNYGLWSNIPGYGAGWVPYGVGAGWMPFMNGQWQFMGGTGWNWTSGEPWGWVPYHFGSWVNSPGIGWAWLPVGATSYVPATASWVNVNNQLAWIPNGPPLTSKATKTQLAAIPTTAILSGQSEGGSIKAGASVPVARDGMMLHAAHASAPTFTGITKQSAQAAPIASASANSKSFVQSPGAPASLRGPAAAASELRVARLSSAPRSMMAPHSPPMPAIARGASMSGTAGAIGAHGSANTSVISGSPAATGVSAGPAASSQGSAMGSASHSGGSMGSSGGRH
jgi:FecR protein